MDTLGVRQADFVTHDIGNMIGYAFAAGYSDRVTRFVPIDAPIPGIGPWEQIVQDPRMWQFGFGGPDMELMVAGRERIYLDRFWNEFSLDPKRFDENKRQHYAALYAMPDAIRAGFAQFAAFSQDVLDNRAFLANGKLTMPVLAIGGDATSAPFSQHHHHAAPASDDPKWIATPDGVSITASHTGHGTDSRCKTPRLTCTTHY